MRTPASSTPIDWGRMLGFAVFALLVLEFLLLAEGLRQNVWLADAAGRPLCRDFSVFWAAGRLAGQGLASQVYDWPAVREFLLMSGQAPGCTMPMFYPPSFLIWLAPFGLAPYAWAAALWVAASLLAYLGAIRLAAPQPRLMLLALAAPGVVACLAVGQNGLLTAALAVAGLALIDRRPILAGLLLGALAYKPQFGLLLPVALVAAGRWKTIAAAAVSVAAGGLLAGVAFGWSTYALFVQAMLGAGQQIVQAGALEDFKQQSVHALAHALGAGPAGAWAWQGAAALAAATGVAWLWRRGAPWPCRAAGLLTGMLAASPYSGIYDFPVLAAAVVVLLSARERPVRVVDGICLATAYLAPLAYGHVAVPIGPAVYALLALAIALRLRTETSRQPLAAHDLQKSFT